MSSAQNGRVIRLTEALDDKFPDAECELIHTNAFELVIAVMLSAQTTDKAVNKVTVDLFEKYKTPDDYINVPTSELENDIRRIGLYKNKAKNLKLLSERVKTEFEGVVPDNQEGLESLPGVGRKTANVVLSVWFGVPRVAVDTHVDRVSKRLKLAYKNDSVLKVEQKLMRKLPKEKWSKVHHQMIFFGRYFCKAKNPNCKECPLTDICRGA